MIGLTDLCVKKIFIIKIIFKYLIIKDTKLFLINKLRHGSFPNKEISINLFRYQIIISFRQQRNTNVPLFSANFKAVSSSINEFSRDTRNYDLSTLIKDLLMKRRFAGRAERS